MPNTSRVTYKAASFGRFLLDTVVEDVDAHMDSLKTFKDEVQALRADVVANPGSYPSGALAEIDAFIAEQKAKITAFIDGDPIPPGGQGDQSLRESLVTARAGSIWEIDELVSAVVAMLLAGKAASTAKRADIVNNPGDYPPDALAEIDEVNTTQLARIEAFRDSLP